MSRDPRGGYPSGDTPVGRLPPVPIGPAPGAPGCRCGKVRFFTKRAAKQAVRRMTSRKGSQILRAYRCPTEFTTWHIGHTPGVILRGEVSRQDYPGMPSQARNRDSRDGAQ